MSNGDGVIDAMAQRLVYSRADLSDLASCALALVRDGFSGADIGDDLHEITRRARLIGARNPITDIAATVASLQPKEDRCNGF